MELFGEKGYLGTSMRDILQRAGANSGSLYHFFSTKQELLLAVLERYETGIHAMLVEPATAGVDDPVEKVFALLAAYRGLLVASDCTYGCPIGSLALELHEPDPPVRERLAANFANWTGVVRTWLADPRAGFPAGTDADALATLVLSVMEGGVMLARTARELAPFDAVVGQLRSLITRLQTAGPGSAGKPDKERES
jgi:AcrR family transcriptional regulator